MHPSTASDECSSTISKVISQKIPEMKQSTNPPTWTQSSSPPWVPRHQSRSLLPSHNITRRTASSRICLCLVGSVATETVCDPTADSGRFPIPECEGWDSYSRTTFSFHGNGFDAFLERDSPQPVTVAGPDSSTALGTRLRTHFVTSVLVGY